MNRPHSQSAKKKKRRPTPRIYWSGGVGFIGPGAKKDRDKWHNDTLKAMGLK